MILFGGFMLLVLSLCALALWSGGTLESRCHAKGGVTIHSVCVRRDVVIP
jgi:hypothetical protein